MSEWIKLLFVKIFGANSWLATLIISMIPIVELRGAIPFGAATALWGENALPLWLSFLVSVAGSSFVCVFLAFLFWPIFNWLKKTKLFKRIADFVERKLNKNSENIEKKAGQESDKKKNTWIKIFGIFVFVAIPLPLTGVWTGTCLALFIGLNRKQTIIPVLLGNLVAGSIMTLISYFFADNTLIVLLVFLALVVVFTIYEVIKSFIKKRLAKKKDSIKESANENDGVVKSLDNTENEISTENVEEVQAEEVVVDKENDAQDKEEKLMGQEDKETK